jgi:NAD(P)-dependent dehydrogenase (short-subunit alcohol dehydrogenase family)
MADMSEVAIVTGGASGLGLASASRLAEQGMTVVLVDIDEDKARAALDKLAGEGHRVHRCDISVEDQVIDLFRSVREAMGPVRVVVNCAGLIVFESETRPTITGTTLKDWNRTFDVNAAGAFLVTREMMRMQERERVADARIIHISSSGAQLGGYRGSSAYFASKGAVLSLTKAAAREAAESGMTVNAIAPGMVDTPMLRLAVPVGKEGPALERVPLARLGKPDDIAAAVAYLASRDAGYVTGSVIDVNGGLRMQ